MGDNDNKRGFSGLSDLASDINKSEKNPDESRGERSRHHRSSSNLQLMAYYGIDYKFGSYLYEDVKYKTLEDAINAAENCLGTSPTEASRSTSSASNTKPSSNGETDLKRPISSSVGGVSNGRDGGSPIGRWLLGLGIVVFVVWLMANGGTPSARTQSSSQVYTPPPSKPAVAVPATSRYYVTAMALNVRNKPSSNGVILSKLNQFDTVTVYPGSRTNGWIEVETGSFEGWVAEKYLAPGEGRVAYNNYCRSNISRPSNGYVFSQKQKGEHSLTIQNSPGNDVIAKLKDRRGNTVVSFYVREGQNVTISSIPSGSYKFQYASGRTYSRECGEIFLDDMQASEDPSFTNYEITNDGYSQYIASMKYTLYKVSNGNFQPNSIAANKF